MGLLALATVLVASGPAAGEQLRADLYRIDAEGLVGPAGEVLLADSAGGARLLVELRHVPPGRYRIQIHRVADCGPGPDDTGAMAAGVLAGDRWVPADGVGDAGMVADQPPPAPGAATTPPELPPLEVGGDGYAYAEMIVPEITEVQHLWHRSFVVHDARDARVACGVVG